VLTSVTCVGWKVTLCDPIWQVTLHSCEMVFHEQLYQLYLFKPFLPVPWTVRTTDGLFVPFVSYSNMSGQHGHRLIVALGKY